MNSGWPDDARPGVPIKPEQSGSHWVRDANCETVTADWNADVQKWAPWPFCPPEAFAGDNDYLGPCLTPTEVAALVEQARREEREACAVPKEPTLQMVDAACLKYDAFTGIYQAGRVWRDMLAASPHMQKET